METRWPNIDAHFNFITACKRENAIREGRALPRNDDERRQLAEGPVARWVDLDAFQFEPNGA